MVILNGDGENPADMSLRDGKLALLTHRIFSAYREVYGSPPIKGELRDQGIRCSKERVARLMREMELGALPRRKGGQIAPNLLGREFGAKLPRSQWGSSPTSVWTAEGWLDVAVMLDLFSRLVVGWAMDQHNDELLVREALEMARLGRSPPEEILFHSDQGSPYTATGYLKRLADLGMVVSMSRTGDGYENAVMESFAEHSQRGMR